MGDINWKVIAVSLVVPGGVPLLMGYIISKIVTNRLNSMTDEGSQ